MLEILKLLFNHFDEIFGLLLLLIVAGLIAMIGLGHVEELTSYGLRDVVIILGVVAGAWSNYRFGRKKDGQTP